MTEVKTNVDQLMQVVREKGKLSVAEAAKQLGVPEKTVQAWVDFLVDEHILGIEYKFTTPYIYVHSEDRLKAAQEEQKHTLKDFKDVFFAYAQQKNMPPEKLPHLWNEHLKYAAENQKQYFIEECKRQGLKEGEKKYDEYLGALISGA